MRSDTRIKLTAVLTFLSLAAAGAAPLWVLLFSPIVLGVPHVFSDLRCLILRPLKNSAVLCRADGPPDAAGSAYAAGHRAADLLLISIPIGILLILGTAAAFGLPRQLGLEIGLGLSALLIAALRSPMREEFKAGAIVLLAGAAAFLITHPRATLISLVHLHNFIAVAIWYSLFQASRSRGEGRAIVALFFGSAAAAAVIGVLLPDLAAWGGSPDDFSAAQLQSMLLPGFSAAAASVVVRVYAFMQLVHYVIWLFLVPSSSRSSSLRSDLGLFGLLICIFLTAAVVCAGLYLPVATREAYLTASSFHAWLELAFGLYLMLVMRCAAGKLSPPQLETKLAA